VVQGLHTSSNMSPGRVPFRGSHLSDVRVHRGRVAGLLTEPYIEHEGRARAAARILRRALLMYLLGSFTTAGQHAIQEIRLLGVLQRTRFPICSPADLLLLRPGVGCRVLRTSAGVLGADDLRAVPGVGQATLEPGQNLANWVDKNYLPLRRWSGDYDPKVCSARCRRSPLPDGVFAATAQEPSG